MKFSIKKTVLSAVIASMLALPGVAFADFEVAVASNFKDCLISLIAKYNQNEDPDVTITYTHNSSGNLIGEIETTPTKYQLFLSADAGRPASLVAQGKATNNQTYANGVLVSFSKIHDDNELARRYAGGDYAGPPSSVAVANPTLAPYGLATQQAFASKGDTNLYSTLVPAWGANFGFNPQIFDAHYINIGTTLDAVLNNSKDIAFVAKGQVINLGIGNYLEVPTSDYSPIVQNGCVIYQGGTTVDSDADAFFAWMLTDADARGIISSFGYN